MSIPQVFLRGSKIDLAECGMLVGAGRGITIIILRRNENRTALLGSRDTGWDGIHAGL